MLFNTVNFLMFLLAVLGIYALTTTYAQRATVILVASLLFYVAWKPAYLLLLIGSLSINYLFYAALMRRRSRPLLTTAVVLNLSVLAACKYLAFLVENTFALWGWVTATSAAQAPDWLHWALPLGVSFYTFHMLSVMIDVYRGDWTRQISFRSWSLYVTFFPHMVAGPILRASELVEQLEQIGPLRLANLRFGALLFLAGLLKKLLLADHLAPLANLAYANPELLTTSTAWLGTTAFALQIYYDFSGYSEMAIGLAWMFGVRLPRNFLYPYISRNPREFWQRWHITLSRWLRDYLYVSLGGSRVSYSRNLLNLLLTMVIGGLWHGAAWTFVVWGFIHGGYLVLHRFVLRLYENLGVARFPGLAVALSFLGWPCTIVVVAFSWVFFRAASFESAWVICQAMLGLNMPVGEALQFRTFQIGLIAAGAVMAIIEPWFVRVCEKRDLAGYWWSQPAWLRGVGYAGLALFLIVFGGAAQKFIYFDF